jgi:plasmid stability protein
MAILTIRNVDTASKEQLRLRAILQEALSSEEDHGPNLAQLIRRRFESLGGVELVPHPPVPLGGRA